MKKYLMLGIIAVLLAASTTIVFAGKTKESGYCYHGYADYYEKSTVTRNKITITTYTIYEDDTMYQFLGQEQFHGGEVVPFYDSYTKNDFGPGTEC